MSRNFGFQRHRYQPVTWGMWWGDVVASRKGKVALIVAALLACAFLFAVSARADDWSRQNPNYSNTQTGAARSASRSEYDPSLGRRRHPRRAAPVLDANGARAEIIGGRPAGCPHAYCGCGLRKYLGIDDARLNLAWNWTKYYRGGRAVAVWHHHVALIEQMVGPRSALLRDFNSGGGLSRLHVRSIAGAVIVNGYGREARL